MPITASSDVWSQVIANVAPVIALVGECNAKEFLRASSSRDQLFVMATAPLGILSLMISAIRLSRIRILRRLAGRDAEQKSNALVELTPLSVAPASSVYTSDEVEIKPSEQRDRLAFVCAHVRCTTRVYDALKAFKELLRTRDERAKPKKDADASTGQDEPLLRSMKRSNTLNRSMVSFKGSPGPKADETQVEKNGKAKADQEDGIGQGVERRNTFKQALDSVKQTLGTRDSNPKAGRTENTNADQDYEIVLGMKGSTLTADETALLVTSVLDEKVEIEKSLAERIESTSLSFRMTGVSPTQTDQKHKKFFQLAKLRNVLAGTCSFVLMAGVQVCGYYFNGGQQSQAVSLGNLIMGLIGYCGIVIFTFALLIMVKQEIEIDPQPLLPVFDNAVWTFSDSRHAEHRKFDKSPDHNFVQAAPKRSKPSSTRDIMTACVCTGLVGSYVVYYLGVRVAQWWVALSNLMIIWISVGFRAGSIRGFLKASENQDLGEHWLGIFRDNLSESLLATVEVMERNKSSPVQQTTQLRPFEQRLPDSSGEASSSGTPPSEVIELQKLKKESGCTLVVAKPIRQSLRNWSGCEDILRVALGMAKHAGEDRIFTPAGQVFRVPSMPAFKRIIRFQLMIYVPGVVWKAGAELDYILTESLDVPNLYRDIMKILHLCGHMNGSIVSRQILKKQERAEVSNVLCGPVTIPGENDLPDLPSSLTLVDLLCVLRDLNPPHIKAYTLEQALLLPAIQLALMYESWRPDRDNRFSRIQQLQNGHTDKLMLSGGKHLPTLERVFEEIQIWDHFTVPKPPREERELQPRDETSGLYERPARSKTAARDKMNEQSWLQDTAFSNRPGSPGR